jgi:hypothetical protein
MNHSSVSFLLLMIILLRKFVLTNQNQFIMENINKPNQPRYRGDLSRLSHGGKTELHRAPEDFKAGSKRIEDPMLKGSVCKTAPVVANY